jgi:hypothetical protein
MRALECSALAFVASGQQHHQAAGLSPFCSQQEMNWSIMICARWRNRRTALPITSVSGV